MQTTITYFDADGIPVETVEVDVTSFEPSDPTVPAVVELPAPDAAALSERALELAIELEQIALQLAALQP